MTVIKEISIFKSLICWEYGGKEHAAHILQIIEMLVFEIWYEVQHSQVRVTDIGSIERSCSPF